MTCATVCLPAQVCWHNYKPIIQIGHNEDATWWDRDGHQIDREALHFHGRKAFHYGVEMGYVHDVGEAVTMLGYRYSAAGYDYIFLASNEWGNETMDRVAQEHFAAHPECEFVEVHEHAGWYLGYRRDGSIWATANDTARLQKPWPRPAGLCGKTIRRQPA
jgi:hypothetical protein